MNAEDSNGNGETEHDMSLITGASAIYATGVKAGRSVALDGPQTDQPFVIEFEGRCLNNCEEVHRLHVLITPDTWHVFMAHLLEATREFMQ